MNKKILKVISILFLFGFSRIGFTNAYLVDRETSTENVMTAGCWAPPTKPVLTYPSDGLVVNNSSGWLTDPYMDWSDSWVCPDKSVSYQYELYSSLGSTSLVFRSDPLLTGSEVTFSATADGNYYWLVRAYDGEKWSEWSDIRHLTIDRTAPPIPLLIYPGNNTSLNSSSLVQTWQQVYDNLGGDVFYDYESYNDAGLSSVRWVGSYSNSANGNGTVVAKQAQGAQNGDVYWRVRARDERGNIGSWSSTGHFVIQNSLPNPTPDGSSTPNSSPVVLNEILPDPLGDDNLVKPNGEWVELYNKSDAAISVSGWNLTDANGNLLLITGEITNTGGTDIPGHGFLVIYTGSSILTLDNGGDTVNIYNGTTLIDSHTYGSTPEGKSIAKYPDGGDTWYDPIPTPGGANVLETEGESSVVVVQETPENSEVVPEDDSVIDEVIEPTVENPEPMDSTPLTTSESDEVSPTPVEETVPEAAAPVEAPVEEANTENPPEAIVEEPETDVVVSADPDPSPDPEPEKAAEPEMPQEPETTTNE